MTVCTSRKQWYPDEKTAKSFAVRGESRAYHCPHCDGWHLTTHAKKSRAKYGGR